MKKKPIVYFKQLKTKKERSYNANDNRIKKKNNENEKKKKRKNDEKKLNENSLNIFFSSGKYFHF